MDRQVPGIRHGGRRQRFQRIVVSRRVILRIGELIDRVGHLPGQRRIGSLWLADRDDHHGERQADNITYTSTAHDDKSLEIEKRAIPTLKSEAVKANSADISSASGATYTSTKYKASLQAALDAAQ